MKVRRLLPYIIGLTVLAFALGSLPRATPGGSILFRSTWLLYLIYLGPIVILGALVASIIMIAMNWRSLAEGIGFGIAQRRRTRKRGSRLSFVLSLLMWGIAIGILIEKPGSIFNPVHGTNSTTVTEIVGSGSPPPNPLQTTGILPAISNLVDSSWFTPAFLGLLIIGSFVLVQSVRVSMREMSDVRLLDSEKRTEGLQAVDVAIKLVDDKTVDPRSRIMACYHHMITTVSRLGAPVRIDQTARELDRAIRATFSLKGTATGELTRLFEEARYSLHEIHEEEAAEAHEYLESIAAELKVPLDN